MKYDYDIITIGLGPAGMATTAMGAAMGLRVCAIEKNKIGGECMNIGCIPSKALLKIAKTRYMTHNFPKMGLAETPAPSFTNPFPAIQEKLDFINEKKIRKMFESPKIDLFLEKGSASFVDPHTIMIGDEKKVTGRKIFIATGSGPSLPPLPGLEKIKDQILTNENIFHLEKIPKSMIIIGGGAIGCEMAQAFQRLDCKCQIIQMDSHLLPLGDTEAGVFLEELFAKEGIEVYNSKKIEGLDLEDDQVILKADGGLKLKGEKILIAAGRRINLEPLKLENADIYHDRRGIKVDDYLRTNHKHIYAIGDCNNTLLFSHAAMHQGMLALLNAVAPWPFRYKFKEYVTPWTVFSDPPISAVGMLDKELTQKKIKFSTVKMDYADYGATIAEGIDIGFIKAYTSPTGRIYGASIVGEGSGDIINQWAMAIQKKMRITDIVFLQHSFPSHGFITKMLSEKWMMNKMNSRLIRLFCRIFCRA